MSVSRYSKTSVLNFGSQFGTNQAISTIRAAIADGSLKYQTIILKGTSRLDTISAEVFGDSSYWWILAASSNIGWGLQSITGTIIKVPALADVLQLIG